jgi:hypothetical protein
VKSNIHGFLSSDKKQSPGLLIPPNTRKGNRKQPGKKKTNPGTEAHRRRLAAHNNHFTQTAAE